MSDEVQDLVRIDPTGAAHPVGRHASQWMRGRQGTFRLMPGPPHLVFMRYVGEDGKRDAEDGAVCRLAGEITTPGTLCDVVSLVAQTAWRGELIVMTGPTTRNVYFDKGQVLSAHSTAEGERLGEVLYRYGVLTEEEVDTVIKACTPELRFGEAAVKLGYLTREKLFEMVAKQSEEVVYAVLRVADGMFYVLDNFDESRLSARLNLSVSSLLLEGVRRMDEMSYFRERIPSDQHVPDRVAGKGPPEDQAFLSVWNAINGQRNIQEICRTVEQGEFEVTQALFQMLQQGIAVVQPPKLTGRSALIARFNQAMQLLMEQVDKAGRGMEIREQLSSFASGAGVYDVLFQGAGPAQDGTVAPDRISDNVAMLVGLAEGDSMLSQWLYEYASFGLFVAEPVMRSSDPGLTKKVADLIGPLAPK